MSRSLAAFEACSQATPPAPWTVSGVMRVMHFELAIENESARDWPGERVETNALFAPTTLPNVVSVSAIDALLPTTASEPLVTAAALYGALLGIVVLGAGSAAATAILALAFFG